MLNCIWVEVGVQLNILFSWLQIPICAVFDKVYRAAAISSRGSFVQMGAYAN